MKKYSNMIYLYGTYKSSVLAPQPINYSQTIKCYLKGNPPVFCFSLRLNL